MIQAAHRYAEDADLEAVTAARGEAARCGVAVLATNCGWAGRVDEIGLTSSPTETGAVGFAATPRNGFVRGPQTFTLFCPEKRTMVPLGWLVVLGTPVTGRTLDDSSLETLHDSSLEGAFVKVVVDPPSVRV
jgi:hypothetical protein